jgi:hypothetical protein
MRNIRGSYRGNAEMPRLPVIGAMLALMSAASAACRFRNLDSCVSMVQPGKDRMRNNVSEPLDLARVGRVLPERNVSSNLIIIGGVVRENSSKMLCVEHD